MSHREEAATAAGEDSDAAFATKGHRAAVFKPRFGQAHQQYLTVKWLCEAAYEIALHAFGLDLESADAYNTTLNVIDPTCGSGRLLAPFTKGEHNVLGIELDDRLAATARRALGKEQVRQGDIMAYGSVLPTNAWHVAVINPPYGLWWQVGDNSPYRDYELASEHHIESQHMVLELVSKLLTYQNGLLVAVMSGKFFDNNPHAAAFLGKHYQVVAHILLPKPFKEEYGIDVDAAFVVAVKDSPYSRKKPAPLTGSFDFGQEQTLDGGKGALVKAVNRAYDHVKRNTRYRAWDPKGPGNRPVSYLRAGWRGTPLPDVPRLDMAVTVDTSAIPLRLTARGVSAAGAWSRAWLRFYGGLPLQAYDAAQGCLAPLGEAYGSLPNILIAGVAESQDRLSSLGFEVGIPAHDQEQIRRRAKRYARDRLPIRELQPAEYLAWYEDGPITAQASATLPGAPGREPVVIPEGATYELRVRWVRRDEVVRSEDRVGKGKKGSYTLTTHVDRGHLILRFHPAEAVHNGVALKAFTVAEIDAPSVKAMVAAFGLPEVRTVDQLPEMAAWRARLERFMDFHQEAAGGRRLYPVQALDVVRMASKSSVALLYEMGGGVRLVSCWYDSLPQTVTAACL